MGLVLQERRDLRHLGQPGEIELRQARLELHRRIGRLGRDRLHRELALEVEA